MKKKYDKNITSILQKLKKDNTVNSQQLIDIDSIIEKLSGFGINFLKRADSSLFIDLTAQKIFSGISEFAHSLANDFFVRYSMEKSDVLINKNIDKLLTPELAELEISSVSLYCRNDICMQISSNPKLFINRLKIVFDSLQHNCCGSALFPDFFCVKNSDNYKTAERYALLFPFHLFSTEKSNNYLIFLEYDSIAKFLRLTVEDSDDSRLHLKRIQHRVVTNIERKDFLKNLNETSEKIFFRIHSATQNNNDKYSETPDLQPELFSILIDSGLSNLNTVNFIWSLEKMELLLLDNDKQILKLLIKILFFLGNTEVIQLLALNQKFHLIDGNHWVEIDLSRNGACLNICLDKQREKIGFSEHLEKMPCLDNYVKFQTLDFKNARILLLHHITSQILGLIKAFDLSSCEALTTLFIKYKGVVPDEYFETLFSLPHEKYSFFSLQKIEMRDSIEGNYILSKQYSPVNNLKELDVILRKRKGNFLNAMRLTGFYLFFKEAFEARKKKQILLLIEDGGYLAPLLNKYCLQGLTLGNVLELYYIKNNAEFDCYPDETELKMDFYEWLSSVFYASIEHTRNGFDKLTEVENEFKKLAFPAFSIAISNTKNREARVCAVSIINAIETILHSLGKGIYKRNIIVIGSRGNIGSCLMDDLSFKTYESCLTGVDIKVDKPRNFFQGNVLEFKNLNDIPEQRLLDTDVIIGITGKSILKKEIIEKLILCGNKQSLFFASGSTKTAEFEDLTAWLQNIIDNPPMQIAGINIDIKINRVIDPQTGVVQGNCARIIFSDISNVSGVTEKQSYKDIFMFGDLTPINFLYYGVPAEIIDEVLCQLFRVSLNVVNSYNNKVCFPKRLLAVDRDIDEDTNIIKT